MNVLLIVAAGKSSRFGGFPKALCRIGNRTNAENTIQQAMKVYDKIYIGVNRDTYAKFNGQIADCEMFSIVTGQGDAHSILKCLDYIKVREKNIKEITICWGDAVFVDEIPFKKFLKKASGTKVAVACSVDPHPYAWFETDKKNGIVKALFANNEIDIEKGLHDQSIFLFDFNFAIQYLNEYRESLGIPYDNDENNADKNEMKLLYSFEYLYQNGYDCAMCVEIPSGKVLSFNTQDELSVIKKLLSYEETMGEYNNV